MAHLQFKRLAEYLAIVVLLMIEVTANGQFITDYSRKECKRPNRPSTLFVVTHNTEAGDRSSLASVKRSGTCNFLVTTDGKIHINISIKKIAYHAGRSMWHCVTNLSTSSIGIEVVGRHDKMPNEEQIIALRFLYKYIKKVYPYLTDDKFVTHSMVAYGSPNKWFHFNHRGRKRCGMLFATKEFRQKVGLKNVFNTDPDVDAHRLRIADPYLAHVLYGGKKPKQESAKRIKGANEDESDNDEKFEGFRTVLKKGGIKDVAGDEYNVATTIYFFKNGFIRSGKELSGKELKNVEKGTKVLVGYAYGGKISSKRSAYSVVGTDWNQPSTYYRFPDGTIKTGDDVDDDDLPSGTIVLFRKFNGRCEK